MKPITLLLSLLIAVTGSLGAASKPNIIFIMADDLGYGDVQCLNPERGKIPTPHADRLAAEGMTFTDAHSGSSVCTPTRYGVMTGRYSWRSRLQKGVVTGFAPCLIAPERPTVASFLKGQGYHTGIVGKWHLDFEYLDPESGERYSQKEHKTPPVGAKIPDGPVHRGFDYYHGFHHARNMEAVIEDDRVIAHDDVINMLPRLAEKAAAYVRARAIKKAPFFLYFPLGSPHTPIVPTTEWEGKSGLGSYGDFVMQTDAAIGAVLEALEETGVLDDTLVIFTSDNGCSKAAKIDDLQAQGHYPSAHLRGSKADIWEGGHRTPFLVRWPKGGIAESSTSAQTICHTDFFATCADILGADVPAGACEDSVSYLAAFQGEKVDSTRAGIIHHSVSGHFAYREGDWKFILASGSAGWTAPKHVPDGPPAQLYDLASDPGETDNLYVSKPEVAARLLKQIEDDVFGGRSTEGPESKNDAEVDLWKKGDDKGTKKKSK